jgi:polysaccharide chain length determinant protein (PEP-CTERM system associated)
MPGRRPAGGLMAEGKAPRMNDVKRLTLFYLDQLWRRRWLALSFAWAVCAIGWLSVSFIPDRYVSEARFYVDTMSLLNPLLKGISVNADDRSRDQEVAIMQRTLTSKPNLTRVAQMTDLDKSIHSEGELQALIKSLEDRISITSQGTNLFAVEFSDNSPATAKSVVQALLTIFLESSAGNKREDIQTAKSFIETQISEYESQLKTAEQKLADFKVKNVGFFSSSSQTFAMRLELAREAIDTQKAEYNDAMVQRDELKRQLEGTPRLIAVDAAMPYGTGVATGTPLQQQVRALQTKLAELRTQYTEKHPDVIQTEDALKRLTAPRKKGASAPEADDINAPSMRIPNDLYAQLSLRYTDSETRVSSAKRKLDEAQRVFTDMEEKANEAPRVEAEFTNLNRDYEVLKASYEGLLQRRESARIAQAADTTTEPVQFRLIAPPELPARPAGPMRAVFNTIVLVLGIAAGIGFVILMTEVDDSVATPDDLAAMGNFPVLGCVSNVAALDRRVLWGRGADKFNLAATALAGMFVLVLVSGPNLSGITQKMTLWFS